MERGEKSPHIPKLGILLTTSPENGDSSTVIKLAEAALGMGHPVEIFLMCDGVYNALSEDMKELRRKGAVITLCALNAGQRGVTQVPEVVWGSQYDLARSVHECDAFLAFN